MDVEVLFVLCILCTQICQQADVVDVLKHVSCDEKYRMDFERLMLKHCTFLFEVSTIFRLWLIHKTHTPMCPEIDTIF